VGAYSRADIAVVPHLNVAAFLGYPVSPTHANLAAWFARMNERPAVARATQEALQAFEGDKGIPDPFFNSARLHWRGERIEWVIRLGLGRWLLDEIAEDRGFFSPVP
jgi:hypothetical protein